MQIESFDTKVVDTTAKRPEALLTRVLSQSCRSCGVVEGNLVPAGQEGPVKLLRCALCQLTTYCSSQCQRSDWKRHKRVECLAPDSVDEEHTRADFRDAAMYWMKQCEAEMRYAVRCGLRPGLKGDRSATHTVVVEWVFDPKERRRRFQFRLLTATVVPNEDAASRTPAGSITTHGPTSPSIIIPLRVLSFFRTADSQHLYHSQALLTHPPDHLNLIDEDWLDVLRKSLSHSKIPTDAELLLQQLQARPDGGLAEAIEQGFADEHGEWIVDRSSGPNPSTGVAKNQKKKKQHKRKKGKNATDAALLALGPEDSVLDSEKPLPKHDD